MNDIQLEIAEYLASIVSCSHTNGKINFIGKIPFSMVITYNDRFERILAKIIFEYYNFDVKGTGNINSISIDFHSVSTESYKYL